MKDSVKEYFGYENISLAWERMIRSTGRDAKDFFGIHLYSRNITENLQRLSDSILTGKFKPTRPFKYYEPKASKTQRTKTVLAVEDSIFYQAIANVVAHRNFEELSKYNHCTFGHVLNDEVKQGLSVLENKHSEYYFFRFYVPLYNEFVNSINKQVTDRDKHYKLETDITGFFDSIPHSKLLYVLGNDFNVEPEIIQLLSTALNIWSGTRDSITPGVGIPQGPASSFFFANIFLHSLDELMSTNSPAYYRYMDDMRIYSSEEDELLDLLVVLDKHLKGKGLSINSKKTIIETLSRSSIDEVEDPLHDYENDVDDEEAGMQKISRSVQKLLREGESADLSDISKIDFEQLDDKSIIRYSYKELIQVQKDLIRIYQVFLQSPKRMTDEKLQREYIHCAYRWRTAVSILRDLKESVEPSKHLIPVWLHGLEHLFWKANHFCWNLNQYGEDEAISIALQEKLDDFRNYEWVQYQILSNLGLVQKLTNEQLEEYFLEALLQDSALVRLGLYKMLLCQIDETSDLMKKVISALSKEKHLIFKQLLLSQKTKSSNQAIKNWLGL